MWLREAKEDKDDLAVLWLDLANAYGSIPYKVVEDVPRRYHVPRRIGELIHDYYDNFQMSFAAGEITSDWHRQEWGIITGCTIFATLFTLAMNMVVKSTEVVCRGPMTTTNKGQYRRFGRVRLISPDGYCEALINSFRRRE